MNRLQKIAFDKKLKRTNDLVMSVQRYIEINCPNMMPAVIAKINSGAFTTQAQVADFIKASAR